MIHRVEELPPLDTLFSGQEAAKLRMESALCAYGTGRPFLSLYFQESGGRMSAAFTCMDGAASVLSGPLTDWEELSSMLRALGCTQVFCERPAPSGIMTPLDTGPVLRCCPGDAPEMDDARYDPSPTALYPVLAAAFGKQVLPPFDAWYPDFSHRQRHGTAHSVLLQDKAGADAACALALTAGRGAYISGLAVLPGLQGQGFGGRALGALLHHLRRKGYTAVFACTPDPARERFYLNRGFTGYGRFYRYLPAAARKDDT